MLDCLFSQIVMKLLEIKTYPPSVSRLRKFLRIYGEIWTKTTETNWHDGRRLCCVNFRGFDLSPSQMHEGQSWKRSPWSEGANLDRATRGLK